MGMFDTVHMECPHCHKSTSEQTKIGACRLGEYLLNEDAITTMGMVDSIICCEECKQPFTVELVNKPWAVPRKLTEAEAERLTWT